MTQDINCGHPHPPMCPGDSDFCPHHGCTTCQGPGYYFRDPHNRQGFIDERNTAVWALILKEYGTS